jgi:uncharacterized protein YkwD
MRSRSLQALVLAFALAFAVALCGPGSALGAPAGCPGADTLPGDGSEATLSKATVCLVNRERTRKGMRALRVNRRLSRAAIAHTRDMINRHYFEHVSLTGKDVVDRLRTTGYIGNVTSWLVGENLAWGSGSRSSPRQIVVAWLNSPGHRRNMLNRRFREIGIGVVFSTPSGNAPTAATYTTTFGYRR